MILKKNESSEIQLNSSVEESSVHRGSATMSGGKHLLFYSAVSGLSTFFVLPAECEREKRDLIMATAQRLKSGLNVENLRKSGMIRSDGIEVYTPKSNFGRFTRQGLMIARVAAVEIKCNHKDLVELLSTPNSRQKWDTSCLTVYPIKSQPNNSGSLISKGLTHFVEKSSILGTFLPSRDYVVEIIEPYPGKAITLSQH